MKLTLLALLAALLAAGYPAPRMAYTITTCSGAGTVFHFFVSGSQGQAVGGVHVEVNGQKADIGAVDATIGPRTAVTLDATIKGRPYNPVLSGGATVDGSDVTLENAGTQANPCALAVYLPVVARP